MESLLQDLRFSFRMLGRNPGLMTTVLMTFALGIGANTAIFTVDYATLLAPLPYPQPNQLVMVWSRIQDFHNGVSAGDYTDWKNQATVFQDLSAWPGQSFNIATRDQPEYLNATAATPGMLKMMGEPLFMGRYFLPEEGIEGNNHVVILTHKLWMKLGANRNIIGTTLQLDGQPYTVVGVERPGMYDRQQAQMTVPLVLMAGSMPAWYASRVDPAEALKEGGRTGTSAGKHRLRRVLVVGEFTLALVLLAGAGLAIHSFWNLTQVDLGIRTDHVLTFFLPVPDQWSKDPALITSYYRVLLARIGAVPGVEHVSAQTGMPLYGAGFGMPFTIVGGPEYADRSQRPGTQFGMVTPDYFATFGIRLMKGRLLNDADTANSVKVAVANESLVRKWLVGRDPLRTQIAVEQIIPGVQKLGPAQNWQIVGVYHDVHAADQTQFNQEMLIPFWQCPWPQAGFGVRTAEEPMSMLHSVAAAVHSVDPEIALAEPHTMDEVRDDTMSNERFTLTLFVVFAGVALLLAALGIYGVMALQRGAAFA